MSIRLIVVEPWFAARGHPAQSLLNTARILGRRGDVAYVVAAGPADNHVQPIIDEIAELGDVKTVVAGPSPALSTLRCFRAAMRLARGQSSPRVFFMDAHVLALAAADPILRRMGAPVDGVGVLGLFGPEQIAGAKWRRGVIQRWLLTRGVRLFLRTEELAQAWREAFPLVPSGIIDTLPSLEIPEDEAVLPTLQVPGGVRRFGVIGQVRTGKGLEWLVPLFQGNPQLGELRIEGPFFDDRQRALLPMVSAFPGFREGYIPDQELVARVGGVDYVLALYESWDPRLEAATFYLAARARRPVICYEEGWCGRMVREYGCGISVKLRGSVMAGLLSGLPGRETAEYAKLLTGMERFRVAHSGEARRTEFLHKLAWSDAR